MCVDSNIDTTAQWHGLAEPRRPGQASRFFTVGHFVVRHRLLLLDVDDANFALVLDIEKALINEFGRPKSSVPIDLHRSVMILIGITISAISPHTTIVPVTTTMATAKPRRTRR